jgi:hypothetical protein
MNNIFTKIKNILLQTNTDSWHEDFIIHIAQVLKPDLYVELWLYKCTLFNKVVPHAKQLIWVDLASEPWKYMKKSNKTKFFNMTTDDYYKIIKKEWKKIDLLFIDANHSKESVKQDFENYFNLVTDHWIILLHDGFPKNKEFTQPWYCWDGYKAIEELTKNNVLYEMMTLPVHPWLTLCRKRSTHLNW